VRGRFSKEISLPVPDAAARSKILSLFTANKIKTSSDVDIDDLGRLTPGFVGAGMIIIIIITIIVIITIIFTRFESYG
jgi:ATP-dependent Zn protease